MRNPKMIQPGTMPQTLTQSQMEKAIDPHVDNQGYQIHDSSEYKGK